LGEVGLAPAAEPTTITCLSVASGVFADVLVRLRTIEGLAVPPEPYLHLTLCVHDCGGALDTELPQAPRTLTIDGLAVGAYSVRAIVREQAACRAALDDGSSRVFGITLAYAIREIDDGLVALNLGRFALAGRAIAVQSIDQRASIPGMPFGFRRLRYRRVLG